LDFFLLYFGVGVGLTHFALFLTTFFSSKQLCSDVGGFIFTGLSFMYTAAMDSTSPIWYYISLLFPQNLLSYGIIFWMENQDPKTLDVSGSTFFETFLFDSVLYFLLFMYFDQIMPDSFGVKKKWYFCLQRCASRRSVEQSPLNLEHISFVSDHLSTTDTSRVLIDSDDSSSAMHHEHFENAENNKRSVTIEHISKTFGSVSEKVIDDLSLMIYEKQVYCLLGHNGAGKTTMINILTGILNFDGG
jgi:ATP-binding cassette subfamily A (ABC1) protein 3